MKSLIKGLSAPPGCRLHREDWLGAGLGPHGGVRPARHGPAGAGAQGGGRRHLLR